MHVEFCKNPFHFSSFGTSHYFKTIFIKCFFNCHGNWSSAEIYFHFLDLVHWLCCSIQNTIYRNTPSIHQNIHCKQTVNKIGSTRTYCSVKSILWSDLSVLAFKDNHWIYFHLVINDRYQVFIIIYIETKFEQNWGNNNFAKVLRKCFLYFCKVT